MCKQALWLAPAPPACTPNHHNNNAINYYKQKASSRDGYRLLKRPMSLTKSRILLDDTVLKSWFKSVTSQCRRRMIFSNLHSIKICFTVNSWSPSHWSHNGGWGLFSILNECIKRVWPIRRRLIITSSFLLCIPSDTCQQFGAWWSAIYYQPLYPTVSATKMRQNAGS